MPLNVVYVYMSDPDPTFHFERFRMWPFTLMQIRIWIWILLLIEVMYICEHWHTEPPWLHFEPPRLHLEPPRLRVSFHGIPWLSFEPPQPLKAYRIRLLTLMRIRIRLFDSDVDTDPGSDVAKLCGSGSEFPKSCKTSCTLLYRYGYCMMLPNSATGRLSYPVACLCLEPSCYCL